MERKAFDFKLKGSGDQFYGILKITGKLTHEDYEHFVPMFEQSLQCIKEPKVKMLVDIRGLEGIELQAVWDDLKFTLSHESEFTKIAVVGRSALYEYGVKIVSWFTHCEMQFFEDIHESHKWLGV